MKKKIFCALCFAVVSSLCFAENKFWVFTSGAKNLGYKQFSSVLVHNRTGHLLKVNSEWIADDLDVLFYNTSVVLECEEARNEDFEAVYSVKDGVLDVTAGQSFDDSDYEERPSVIIEPIIIEPLIIERPRVKPLPPPAAKPGPSVKPEPAPEKKPAPSAKPSPSKKPDSQGKKPDKPRKRPERPSEPPVKKNSPAPERPQSPKK